MTFECFALMRPADTPRAVRIAMYLLIFLVAALASAPVLRAGFHQEDFSWLAMARHLDTPWIFFYRNIGFTYFYRPTGLLFWRFCAQLAGTDPWLQNFLDLALQAVNACLVALLATRLAGKRSAGLFAGLMFACLPAASGTALWMSDRFDPVALCFGLLALLAFHRAQGNPRWAPAAAMGLFACLSAKEVGYAVAAAMLALQAWQSLEQRRWRIGMFAAVLIPVVLALALHSMVVVFEADALAPAQAMQALRRGVVNWWSYFPTAIFGFHGPDPVQGFLLAGASALVVVGLGAAVRNRQRETLQLALVGAALVFAPAFLQWPITEGILGGTTASTFTTNLRFYYFAVAGLALLWSAGHAGLGSTRARFLLMAVSLALGAQWLATARLNARAWARETRASSAQYLALGHALAQLSFAPGCRIQLYAPDFPSQFNQFADTIVKGSAPSGASVFGCSVFTTEIPYITIVSADQCADTRWPGLRVHVVNRTQILAPLGNLCMIVFDAAPRLDQGNGLLRKFDVDASGRLNEIGKD